MQPGKIEIKTVGLDCFLVEEMKKFPILENFTQKIFSFSSPKELIENNIFEKKEFNNSIEIFIFNNFQIPSKFMSNRRIKNILCSRNPEKLTKNEIENLYDLWAGPLTRETINFYFKKLQVRINFEFKNSSEELEHQKRILEMARQDYLTGLATRWYLQEYFDNNINEKNITCIYFDLDHFKDINDTYGHQAGDRALAATAEMMQREFSDGFSARLGGDEFMVVLRGQKTIRDVEKRVNDFLISLVNFYHDIPIMKNLSASAGIAQTGPYELKSIDQLIHESDRALYKAKNTGRARCCIYNSSME